jgi:hypothetical protein
MRSFVRISLVVSCSVGVLACAENDSTSVPTSSTPTTVLRPATTTTEPLTFCGVAKIYATEVVDALENESNQAAEDSPMNTRAFWVRYKELQQQMLDLAPAEIKADAEISHESAMAAYDYMEQFSFSMKHASEDPSFAEDERFTGEKYLKAGAAFQGYIDETCDIQLTK